MLIPQKISESFPHDAVLKALSYLCAYAWGGFPSALFFWLRFVRWIPCAILGFLDRPMVVKKSLLSTPAAQPIIDPQDLSSPLQAHGIWEWRDIRNFVLDNSQEWSIWYLMKSLVNLLPQGILFLPKFTQSMHTSQGRDLFFPTHWALQGLQRVGKLLG